MRAGRHMLLSDEAPLGAVTLLRDTFARADNASSLGSCDTGQAWSALSGTWGVLSNRAYRPGITATDCVASVDVGAAWSTFEMLVLSTAEFPGMVFDLTDVNNFYAVLVNNTLRRLELFKRVAGTYTQIAVSADTIFPASTDVRVKVVRTGTSKVIQLSGSTVINVTDASLGATNKIGLRLQTGAGTNASRWSDITVVSPS